MAFLLQIFFEAVVSLRPIIFCKSLKIKSISIPFDRKESMMEKMKLMLVDDEERFLSTMSKVLSVEIPIVIPDKK